MSHEFPVIKTLDDVYAAIDINCFYLVKKDNYQIINYMFSSPEAFPAIVTEYPKNEMIYSMSNEAAVDAIEAFEKQYILSTIKREFRGLKFDLEGNLICRPYHKFFNVGERVETTIENIDVSKPHIILEKLDGSMIAPFIVDGKIIWGTKMGQTEVSEQVEKWLDDKHLRRYDYETFVKMWINDGFTPIFEWCSNRQRIVLDYPESSLRLTAIRHMESGEYSHYAALEHYGEKWAIPIVKSVASEKGFTPEFLEQTKLANDCEGYVIRFADGQMYKIKSDWYCQLHRVKSEVNYERGVVTLLLGGKMDDLKSMMPPHDLARIEKYEAAFLQAIKDAVWIINTYIVKIHKNGVTRKEFALKTMPELKERGEHYVANIIFKLWDKGLDVTNADITELLNSFILSNCGRNVKFDEMRSTTLIFENVPEWKPLMFDSDE